MPPCRAPRPTRASRSCRPTGRAGRSCTPTAAAASARSAGSPHSPSTTTVACGQLVVALEPHHLVGGVGHRVDPPRGADHARGAEQLRRLHRGRAERAARAEHEHGVLRRDAGAPGDGEPAGQAGDPAGEREPVVDAVRDLDRALGVGHRDALGHRPRRVVPDAPPVAGPPDRLGPDHVRRVGHAAVEAAVAGRDVDRIQRRRRHREHVRARGSSISSTRGMPPISCRRAARTSVAYELAVSTGCYFSLRNALRERTLR